MRDEGTREAKKKKKKKKKKKMMMMMMLMTTMMMIAGVHKIIKLRESTRALYKRCRHEPSSEKALCAFVTARVLGSTWTLRPLGVSA